MAKEKTQKISFKTPAVLEGAKVIDAALKTTRTAIEAMPECTISKSLLTSQEAFEKKINAVVKKELIAKALSAIRKNPELINTFPDDVKAGFARNPENIVTTKAVGSDVKKAKKLSK